MHLKLSRKIRNSSGCGAPPPLIYSATYDLFDIILALSLALRQSLEDSSNLILSSSVSAVLIIGGFRHSCHSSFAKRAHGHAQNF